MFYYRLSEFLILMIKKIVSFNLSQELNCENICKEIQRLINSYQKSNIDLTKQVLVISLNDMADYHKNLALRLGEFK
jgi:hypothetical protein